MLLNIFCSIKSFSRCFRDLVNEKATYYAFFVILFCHINKRWLISFLKKVICIFLFFCSCSKDPALWKTSNLNGDSITVLGHGGMGNKSLYPIDSHRSIAAALEMGADGSEMDVQLTSDT